MLEAYANPRGSREGRNIQKEKENNCETIGYETQIRQKCKKIVDIECKNVTVSRIRKDIARDCFTKVFKMFIFHHLLLITFSFGLPEDPLLMSTKRGVCMDALVDEYD